jgi:hypothetical protein
MFSNADVKTGIEIRIAGFLVICLKGKKAVGAAQKKNHSFLSCKSMSETSENNVSLLSSSSSSSFYS